MDGAWSVDRADDRVRWFRPDPPLAPTTAHTWSAAPMCLDEGAFTTSGSGATVTTPGAFEGRTFQAAICDLSPGCSDQSATDPAVVFLSGFSGRAPFTIRVDGLNAATGRVELTLSAAAAVPPDEPGAQEVCEETRAYVGEWLSDTHLVGRGDRLSVPYPPQSTFGADFVVRPTPGAALDLWHWELVLSLEEQPAQLWLVSLTGTFDWRGHVGGHLFDGLQWWEMEDLDTMCGTAAGFGVPCSPCPDGVEACWTGSLPGVASPQIADLIDISVDQTENHLCDGSCDNELDDDGDLVMDADEPECDPGAWPTE